MLESKVHEKINAELADMKLNLETKSEFSSSIYAVLGE